MRSKIDQPCLNRHLEPFERRLVSQRFSPFEDKAPDLDEVAQVKKRQARPAAVGLEGAEIGSVDLERRPPAVGGGSAHAHHGRANRQVLHPGLVLPDEPAKELKIAVHAVVERIVTPLRKAFLAEEGTRMRGLGAEPEHPRPEPLSTANTSSLHPIDSAKE